MGAEAKFKYAPGDIVDVPHLCIDNGQIMVCLLGRSGGKGYRVQSVMGRVFEVEVFEDSVCLPRMPDE